MEKNKIKIANLLLTRNCNLSCSYCRISGDINYIEKPFDYPGRQYYIKNEKDSNWWIDTCRKLKNHNPDVFFILYGGEPFIRWELLEDLVNIMNEEDMNYTIISSCNEKIKPLIYKFFEKVKYVKGFTASIDPGFELNLSESTKDCNDEIYKSNTGYFTLMELIEKGLVEDPVAEMTASSWNVKYLSNTIKWLSDREITTDVTILDIAKNNWYDFSSVTNPDYLVNPTKEVKQVFEELKNSNYKIHMKETLLDEIYNIMPAEVDCELENNFHNITVDSDGKLRLCLRIRGKDVVEHDVNNLFDNNGNYTKEFNDAYEKLKGDKEVLCKGCSWTCILMSKKGASESIINH
jgi:MoaA/NifB/PqqE/SkfB family radical SAM enzyme